MAQFSWLDHLPDGTLESSLTLANQLQWNLEVIEGAGHWVVRSGDQPIFRTDSRSELDAFLYGLALAYAVLPDPVFATLRDAVAREIGEAS